MRFHKPIGTLLLLWPTLWALWLASEGRPEPKILFIFVMGVVVMRAAGCIINDFADRNFDGHVKRTCKRPLATGDVSIKEACFLFLILIFCAFLLVLLLNNYAKLLAIAAVFISMLYPFMKRITNLPQVVLGIAYAWSIPMAFAATTNHIPVIAWVLFLAAALWPVAYDTMYAMGDRDDDLQIGLKSTAILFGQYDRVIIGVIQALVLGLLTIVFYVLNLQAVAYVGLVCSALLFSYQQRLLSTQNTMQYFRAFLNNNYVGLIIFVSILLG